VLGHRREFFWMRWRFFFYSFAPGGEKMFNKCWPCYWTTQRKRYLIEGDAVILSFQINKNQIEALYIWHRHQCTICTSTLHMFDTNIKCNLHMFDTGSCVPASNIWRCHLILVSKLHMSLNIQAPYVWHRPSILYNQASYVWHMPSILYNQAPYVWHGHTTLYNQAPYVWHGHTTLYNQAPYVFDTGLQYCTTKLHIFDTGLQYCTTKLLMFDTGLQYCTTKLLMFDTGNA